MSYSFLTELAGVLTALLVVTYAYFKWSYQYWKRRNFPYLEPSVPLGNQPNPLGPISQSEILIDLYKDAKARGFKHCGIYIIASPQYLVMDLDVLKHILTKDFRHFVDRGTYVNEKDDPIGCHLFALGGKRWKNLRTKLTPTFTSGKMKAMCQTVVDYGCILEEYMEDITQNKEAIDVKDVLGCFTADVIGACAFGLKCNSFKEPDGPFRMYGNKVFHVTLSGVIRFLFAMNYPRAAKLLRVRQIDKDVSDFYSKVVSDAVTYREKNNVVRRDFLQLLIDIKQKEGGDKDDANSLTMDEIIAQCFIFFLAGFETSSTTMTFALFEMALHQDIQDKVREEINRTLAKHNGQVTYEALNEMTYMKQVIDETLRMYPPLPAITRECVEDYKLPGEDLVIEKGTVVLVPIVAIQNDEQYYKNPTEFDPERFNAENKKKLHQYAYLPFGEGPRICIGERFGIMQTKVGLLSFLRKFKFTLNKKTKLPLKLDPKSVTTSALGGIWLDIQKL